MQLASRTALLCVRRVLPIIRWRPILYCIALFLLLECIFFAKLNKHLLGYDSEEGGIPLSISTAPVLIGIFCRRDGDAIYRELFRSLFKLHPLVCSLGKYEGQYQQGRKSQCELIYTFVMGRQLERKEAQETPSELLDGTSPLVYERGDDHVILNIKENMNAGKSQTWFYFASTIMNNESTKFEYVGKMDTDTLLYLDQYFDFARAHLHPSPYNTRTMVGLMMNKAKWYKGEQAMLLPVAVCAPSFSLSIYEDRQARGEAKDTKEHFFVKFYPDDVATGLHLYPAGAFYMFSKDLVNGVVQVAQESRDEYAELWEGVEDHDIGTMAYVSALGKPMNIIQLSEPTKFWEHNIKRKSTDWRELWANEIDRIKVVAMRLELPKSLQPQSKVSLELQQFVRGGNEVNDSHGSSKLCGTTLTSKRFPCPLIRKGGEDSDEQKHQHRINVQQDENENKISLQHEATNDNSSRDRKGHSCLFVVSTSQQNIDSVQQQFKSYQNNNSNNHVDILINIYDYLAEPFTATTADTHDGGSSGGGNSGSVNTTNNIMFSRFLGHKPRLWTSIDPNLVRKYEHIWFLDDDLIFDKKYFQYDHYMAQVKLNDPVISSPKIIQYERTAGRRRRKKENKEEAGEIVDFIEINSFMFKSEAWIWFQDKVLIDISKSSWGPDCFWCRLFKYERQKRGNEFGKVDCFRSLLNGIVHTDTKTLTSNIHSYDVHQAALSAYEKKLNETYNGEIKLNCEAKKRKQLNK